MVRGAEATVRAAATAQQTPRRLPGRLAINKYASRTCLEYEGVDLVAVQVGRDERQFIRAWQVIQLEFSVLAGLDQCVRCGVAVLDPGDFGLGDDQDQGAPAGHRIDLPYVDIAAVAAVQRGRLARI